MRYRQVYILVTSSLADHEFTICKQVSGLQNVVATLFRPVCMYFAWKLTDAIVPYGDTSKHKDMFGSVRFFYTRHSSGPEIYKLHIKIFYHKNPEEVRRTCFKHPWLKFFCTFLLTNKHTYSWLLSIFMELALSV